jgi:hypothetical protein
MRLPAQQTFDVGTIAPSSLQSDDDRFCLGVVFENFVAHFATPAGLFVSAEGQR